MTYDPYGRPQYPVYQQYPPNYYGQPPPRRKTDPAVTIIVVVVIAVVVMVIIGFLACVLLTSWMMPWGPDTMGPETPPVATLTNSQFHNPYEGNGTVNGGGWTISVVAVQGHRLFLDDATIKLKTMSGVVMATMITTVTADFTFDDASPFWYLRASGAATLMFMDGSAARVLDSSSAKDLDPNEFTTVQGAYMVYFDNDGDDRFSAGDTMMVFGDVNADGTNDTVSGDILEITSKDGQVAQTFLFS